MMMKTTWKCKCLCLPLSTTADQGLVSWIQMGRLRWFSMSAVRINKWTPSSVCSSAGLFLDLVNRVTAELWLHNFNEFCCVGVSKYNSGYFYPDYSHLLAFFLWRWCISWLRGEISSACLLCSHGAHDGQIDLHGWKNFIYFACRVLKIFTPKYAVI